MTIKKIKACYVDENGVMHLNAHAGAANGDWLHAARVKEAARAGDTVAAAKLAELESTPMMQEVPDEEKVGKIK